MTYDAFVSYSHAADGELAPALQRGLQRLARPWYRPRALAVFRDETGLAVSPYLWASIVRALDDSEWFVVLCSPAAAGSEWVGREIDHWLAHKDPERILLVLTDGELVWDQTQSTFDPTGSTALPPTLLGTFAVEPRHLDLRWARGEEQLDLRHARFRPAVAELAAPIRNMARDELEAEDVRQHRRTVRLVRGATSVVVLLLVVALILGGLAWQQRGAAQRQAANARREADTARREATTMLARGLAGESASALRAGRTDVALLLASEAQQTEPSPSSRSSLLNALVDQPSLERQLHGLTNTTTALAFSPNNRLLAAAGKRLEVWDLHTGQPLAHQPPGPGFEPMGDVAFADNGRLLIASTPATPGPLAPPLVWDVTTGHILPPPPIEPRGWAVSATAPLIAIEDAAGAIHVWDLRTGRTIGSPITTSMTGANIAVSPDGTTLATLTVTLTPASQPLQMTVTDEIHLWNVATGQGVGNGCRVETTAANSSEYALLRMDLLADDSTVHGATTFPFAGSDAVHIVRCNARTGELTSRTITAKDAIAGVAPDDTIATRDGSSIQVVDANSRLAIGPPLHAPYGGWMVRLQNTVAFSGDGAHYAAAEYAGDVRVWGTRLPSPLQHIVPSRTPVGQLVASPNRRLSIGVGGDIVDTATGRVVAHLTPPVAAGSVALSADGRRLVHSSNGSLTVVDLDQRVIRSQRLTLACATPVGPYPSPAAIAISPRLAVVGCPPESGPTSGTTGTLQAIDLSVQPWRVQAPVTIGIWLDQLQFSSDARALSASGQVGCCGGTQLIDVDGTRLVPRPPWNERNTSSAFTPDGRSLVVKHDNGLTEIVATRDESSVALAPPEAGIQGVIGVSADSDLLATWGPGQALGLWDLATRQLLGTIPLAIDVVRSLFSDYVAFTDTGLTIAPTYGPAASARTDIRFDLDPTSWERDACTIANRNLTRVEWEQYVPGVPYHKTCPGFP
jgi:WD40 repeat protein